MNDDVLKYEVIICWSSDDEAFIAEVPELAGCAADGPTPHEALANAHAIAARELSREIPEPRGRLLYA